MTEETNARPEGPTPRVIPIAGHPKFGPFQTRDPFDKTSSGSRSGGDELSAASGADTGGGDPGTSGDETPRKRRGRPPGAGKKSTATKPELAAARRKLADSLSGVVGFGLSWYGVYRGNKYKQFSPILAQEVYGCYQIKPEVAASIGEPLADTFCQWFPQYIDPVSKGIDPSVAVIRLVMVLQQTSENERITVKTFQQRHQPKQESAPTNGSQPPMPEEPITEWMNQQSPQPEEMSPA